MSPALRDLSYQSQAHTPEAILANLGRDLEIKTSVGIWYFTPGGGRFHDRFVPESTIEERLEMAAEMGRC